MVKKVLVEYCSQCGYFSRFRELAQALEDHFQSVVVEGSSGRATSFEITLEDGTVIFSKLKGGGKVFSSGFPKTSEIIAKLTEMGFD